DAAHRSDGIVEVNEPEAFSWIANALRSPVGEPPRGDHLRIPDLVPPIYESYAKVLHPVFQAPQRPGEDEMGVALWEEPAGVRVPWTMVAEKLGVPHDAALPDSTRGLWQPPRLGDVYEG